MNSLQKYYTFFFLCLCCLGLGQTYTFDKVVTDRFDTEFFPNQKNVKFFNANDYTYFMLTSQREDSIIGRIYDLDKRLMHTVHLNVPHGQQDIYLKTKQIKSEHNTDTFEFSEIKERRGAKFIKLNIRNEHGKRIGRYKMKIKETEKNYFPMYYLPAMEIHLLNLIKPKVNFLVLEAKGYNKSWVKSKYKLISMDDIDLKIHIPE